MSAAVALISGLAGAPASLMAQTFQFGAIGDTGYSKIAEEELSRMIGAMNREKLAFVVHVGDFEADPRPYMRAPDRISMPCKDAHFKRVLAQFQTSAHPFILTPGDNDWTDCHLLKTEPGGPARAARDHPPDVLSGWQIAGRTNARRDPSIRRFRKVS
jgi:hypothetical protein